MVQDLEFGLPALSPGASSYISQMIHSHNMNTGPRVATQALRPGRGPTHAVAIPAAPGTCVRARFRV